MPSTLQLYCQRSSGDRHRPPVPLREPRNVTAGLANVNRPAGPRLQAHAVEAALDIVALCAERTFGDGHRLSVRIGVNTGPMTCGLLGTPDRLVYTVIGDEVNLAARLEALNKTYGTRIIVSERTWEQAGPHAFAFAPIGDVQVRGRSRPTPVYTLRDA